jgi:RNA polymerase sigma factor (sigma-70 family)
MHAERWKKPLDRLRRALAPGDGGGLTDGQLLARFVAGRDEAAFAALLRRHGPMVLGVCRRVLRHEQDSEDCFQAAFLVLAQKAGSVRKRESLASWLYGVAYRVALDARGTGARRRARERQVDQMPHTPAAPAEPQDWRPLLDRELALLREDCRAAVVLCDLEGLSRKEAARRLGVPEGTLSSRLARARTLLARRLAKCGVALSAAAVAALAGEATAAVPAPLACATVRAALLVAAGQAAGVATPAALLMRGVMKAMFIEKLKATVATLVAVVALGAVGLACRVGGGPLAAQPAASGAGRPLSEVEALRKENELLKLNLQVVLEKVRAQETELRALRGRAEARRKQPAALNSVREYTWVKPQEYAIDYYESLTAAPDAAKQAEAALKALRESKDPGVRRAADLLEKALRDLRDQPAKKAPPANQIKRP